MNVNLKITKTFETFVYKNTNIGIIVSWEGKLNVWKRRWREDNKQVNILSCFSFTVNTSTDIFQLPLNMMKCFIRLFIRNVKFVEDSNWAIGMFSFPENSCYTAESFWQLNQHKRIKKPKHSFFYFNFYWDFVLNHKNWTWLLECSLCWTTYLQ